MIKAIRRNSGFDRGGDRAVVGQYRWFVCVGPTEAQAVRSLVGDSSATILIANEPHGGIPDPYEHGLPGYRDCLALLDRVLPLVAEEIRRDRMTE